MSLVTDMTWHETLAALCRRNGTVEVRPIPRHEVLTPTFRVRLLSFGDGGLVIERPQKIDAGRYLVRGADVRVLAADGDNRWELDTTVDGPATCALNEQTVVPALRLTQPWSARSGQRRQFFRVNTSSARLAPVVLQPIEETNPFVLPASREFADDPARPFNARLLNIGGGGLGVEAPQRVAAKLARHMRYRCGLNLPQLSGPLLLIARVVHLEPMPDGTAYLGLYFEFEDSHHRQHCADEICRFTAWFQRQERRRTQPV